MSGSTPSGAAWSPYVFSTDLVAQVHRPLTLDHLDAPQARLARAEQRDAAPGQHRRDVQPDLVDQAGRQRLLGDADAAREQHDLAGLLGRGVRLFGAAQVDLRCVEAIQGEGAVHLRYEVR